LKYESFDKEKSVNVLGFFSKCPGLFGKKTPWINQLLMKPQISLFGAQWGPPGKTFKSVVAGGAVGPHFRLLTLLNFSLEAPMSKSLGEIWAAPDRGKI
jgi:hypothetical protein